MKKFLSLILFCCIGFTVSAIVFLIDPSITINPLSPTVICSDGTDTLVYSVSSSSIPPNTNVVIYQSTDSTFNPYLGQGDSIGYVEGDTASTSQITSTCPKILGIFIDACNDSDRLEPANEYMVITSGQGFRAANLKIDLPNTNLRDINTGSNPCSFGTPSNTLMTSLRTGFCNSSNLIAASQADSIPPNALVIVFTGAGTDYPYNLSRFCQTGQKVYILQNACTNGSGAFVNNDAAGTTCSGAAPGTRYRTTTLSNRNCFDELTYDRCGLNEFDGANPNANDGNYVIRLQNTDTSSVANGGIQNNAADRCNGIVLDTIIKTKILKYAIPQSQCNTGKHFIKAITHPNGTQPISNSFSYQLICNDVRATSTTTNICSGDSVRIDITSTDPNATFTWTTAGGTGITGQASGTGNSIKQLLTYSGTTKDSLTYNITSNDNGCTKTTSVKVVVNASFKPDARINQISCATDSIRLSVANVDANTTYSWTGPNGFSSNQPRVSIKFNSSAQEGDYIVTSTGLCGSQKDTVSFVTPNLQLSVSGNGEVCNGSSVTLIANGQFDSVRWSNGTLGNQNTVTVAGDYTAFAYQNGCNAATTVRVTQCTTSSAIDTLYICQGDSVKLSAPTGYTQYQWTPTNGLSNSTIREPNASPAISTLYVVNASNGATTVDPTELVRNGTFEDSMTYWNTDLFVKTPQCGGCNGWYYVGDITYYCANPDHTPTGTLLFNSSPTEDTSLRVLYQTVNVEKNTNYKFSAYGYAHNSNNAIFNVKINGEEVVSRYELSPDGCSGWENFTGNWFSGNNTTATIVIKDYRQEIVGNDFSLDDISLRKIIASGINDSVFVVVVPLPTPTISGNTSFCIGGSTILTVNGQYDSVRWSTNETTTSISVSQVGNYSVTVFNKGCSGSANVDVTEGILNVSISGDNVLCGGTTGTLTAIGTFDSVRWSTNATTTSINITQSGTYSVTAYSNSNGCSGTASFEVARISIDYFLDKKLDSICTGDTAKFILSAGDLGSSPVDTFTFTQPGRYLVSYQTPSCGLFTDSVVVLGKSISKPAITGNLSICQQQSTTLDAGANYDSYAWQPNGESTQTITASQPGTYTVIVKKGNCSATNAVTVVQAASLNPFSLGNDTTFCGNFSKVLSTGNQSTIWSTGVTAAQISVSQPGQIIATQSNNCNTVSDTIVISQNPIPSVFIGNDTAFCEGELLLSAPSEMNSYVWNNGATSQTISVSQEGTYSVKITDANNCSNSDSITISSNCLNDIWIPNAFSPNNDGVNDVFMVRGNPQNTTIEKMLVYNRWGNKVFEANNILPNDKTTGWNGTYKGADVQFEVYGYYVVAKFKNGEKQILKGNVTLVK